jgi:hypothetical protein
MSDDGLDVVLTWLDENTQSLVDQAHEDVAQAQAVSGDLDSLEARIVRIRAELGEEPEPAPLTLVGLPELQRPTTGFTATPEWEALRAQAEQSLRSRGVDPSTIDLDALLDPEEVARIARRFIGAFTVRTHLDRYDLAIMLIAGLTAALVDRLVVNGAPTSVEQLRDFRPDRDGLTAFFREHSVDSDNWLGDLSHASFDQQRSASGATLDGFRPQTHRDLSLGHDPLLTLTVGVRDVMNGQMTIPGTFSAFRQVAGSQAAVSNPFVAIMIVVAHLLSDAFTPMGIPAPGWTLVNSAQFGELGTDDLSVADLSLRMYTKGYDSRHFLTMATSVAAAELVLRAYWALRCEFDEEYAEDVRREGEVAASEAVSDHPRYQVLAFGAHALACAANAGKVAISGNNWLLFNLPQWTRFVQVSLQLAEGRSVSPTDVLIRTSLSNVEALANGWPDIDVDDPRLPAISGQAAAHVE